MTFAPETVPLGSVTNWLSGGTPNRANQSYWNGAIPWISAATLKQMRIHDSDQHITDAGVRAGSRLAPRGATLILVRGMALHRETRIGVAARPVSFNQDVKALVPKPGLFPEYLGYALKAQSAEILALVSSAGSGTGVLDTQLLRRVPIWVPDEDTQRSVVEAIDSASDQVESLRSAVVKKEAIKQGMMQQLLTGKVRLPGFTEPWREVTLGDLVSYEQPGRYLVGTSKQLESGRVPVLTAGKTFILGYTNEPYGICTTHPVIIFDDFTTASKFVDFDFKAKSSAMKILRPRPDIDLRFVYERMQLIDFPLGDHKRHWISEYSMQPVDVPSQQEQLAISQVLADTESEIGALRTRLTKARAVKQGMMQELLTGRTRLPVAEVAA